MNPAKPRARRRVTPSTEDVIAAVHDGGNHGYVLAMDFDTVRQRIQKGLRTTAASATDWLRAALTDPAQTDYVWLYSNEYGRVETLVRDPEDGTRYMTAEIHPDATNDINFPGLYLDRRGAKTTYGGTPAKRHNWIISRRMLDNLTGGLEREYGKLRADKAREDAEEARTTTQLIGEELALIRGMCFAAGIDLLPPDLNPRASRLEGWAERAPKRGYVARAQLDLRNADVKKLADWLRAQGVKPV